MALIHSSPISSPSITLDSIAMAGAGVVRISQPAKGHRFTTDSILLADFCRLKKNDRVLEPGAGTGVISLLLARKFSSASFTAVELQPTLADLCSWNIHVNSLDQRISVLSKSITRLKGTFKPGSFDAIVANPPFTKRGTGKESPRTARSTSRSDGAAPLEAWLDLAGFLKNGGRYFLVFPAARSAELLTQLRERNLEPKGIRFVHPFAGEPASIILVEAVKRGGSGMDVLPPLIVHGPDGKYTEEVRAIYGS
ncbi:MAG: tRNA1(Val) (adenine(37)-N6)-methyltransferase [Nitrospiraceae bacterium]|nr:tRNA1(Val) (adenine(37)-N6)-methyltransferase [Nitrospiraceae bacterium]